MEMLSTSRSIQKGLFWEVPFWCWIGATSTIATEVSGQSGELLLPALWPNSLFWVLLCVTLVLRPPEYYITLSTPSEPLIVGLKTQMREEISSNWYRNSLQGSTKHWGKELAQIIQHSLVLLLTAKQHWPFPIPDTQSNYIFRLSIRSFFLKSLTRANNNKKPTESYITVSPLAFRQMEKNNAGKKQHPCGHTCNKLRTQLEKEMIHKPQVLSTRLLRLAGSPMALARQKEPKARLKLGITWTCAKPSSWRPSEPQGQRGMSGRVSATLQTAFMPKRKLESVGGKCANLVELGREIF